MIKSAVAVIASAGLAVMIGSAQAVVITDCCDWATGWTFSSYTGAGAGTASAVIEGSGGNPGARLNITTNTPTISDTAFGTAVLTTSGTPAPTAGAAFTLNIDALSGPGAFGQGQLIELLVGQGGSVYALVLSGTGFPLNPFTTLTFNGNFNAGSFSRISGVGPATPSFDGVTVTTYGFAAGNTQSATLTQYYDNFRLTIPSIGAPAPVVSQIPTLSEWAILVLMLLLAGFAARAIARRGP
jgi:hypothetical protein